jgi:hypothetical protein
MLLILALGGCDWLGSNPFILGVVAPGTNWKENWVGPETSLESVKT